MKTGLTIWAQYLFAPFFLLCLVTTVAFIPAINASITPEVRQQRLEHIAAVQAKIDELTTTYHGQSNELKHTTNADTVKRIKHAMQVVRSELADVVVVAPNGITFGDALDILRDN